MLTSYCISIITHLYAHYQVCVCVCVCVFPKQGNNQQERGMCSVVSDSLWPHGACQAPLSMEIFRKNTGVGCQLPSPWGFPVPGIELTSPAAPTLQLDSLSTEPLVKPKITSIQYSKPEDLHSWHYTTILPWGHSHFSNCLNNIVFSSIPRSSPEILVHLVIVCL